MVSPAPGLGLILVGGLAGAINALAGGGPILTLAGLTALGTDPKLASIISTVALSPGQIAAGLRGLPLIPPQLGPTRVWCAIAIALVGGAGGAALLLATGAVGFRRLIPWLILAATAIYAGSGWFGRIGERCGLERSAACGPRGDIAVLPVLAVLAVYGGYFGGGNSFLLLALLAAADWRGRSGTALKNVLVALINLGAVMVLLGAAPLDWRLIAPLGFGGLIGSLAGATLLDRLPTGALRPLVIATGLVTAAWLARG
nr:sulfite exporter TauE/SafE family protein [Novosphingobium piscinae]